MVIISFLLFFLVSHPTFAAPAKVETYEQLIHAIRETRAASQARIEAAVEQEKVREAWETGKLIDEHILQHKERADYGKYVIERLAGDLGMDRTELYRMLRFARVFPIVAPAQQLSWAHYRELLSINNEKKRREMTEEAAQKNWTRETLRHEIRTLRATNPEAVGSSDEEPLVPLKGELNTYRIVTDPEGKLVIDLGFSNFLSLEIFSSRRWPQESRTGRRGATAFKEGDIIRAEDNGELVLVKSATELLQPLQIFSYRARVLEITDGDTIWALVDLGFGIITKQHLRLRGIDASEITSREGQEAKRFVESQLKDVPHIIITASKSDKYDRYLADVWVNEKYLNQELIDQGLADTVQS